MTARAMLRHALMVLALWLGIAAAPLGVPSPARASIAPPPEPHSSCANAEYEAERERRARESAGIAGGDGTPALVVVSGDSSRQLNTTRHIAMGQQVTVCIMGLHDWIYRQKKNPSELRLFIGGTMLAKITPSAVSPSGQEYLNFMLQMDSAEADDWKAWAAIVYSSRHSENHQLPVSIAVANTKQVFESNAVVTIEQYPRRWPFLLAAIALLLGALLYLGASTDLVRYSAGAAPMSPLRRPFSLGLVQMAFWSFLVVAAYSYICVSTRQTHIPMGSMLGLLGISATTGWAAVAVDRQKGAAAKAMSDRLHAKQTALRVLVADPNAADPGVQAEKARYRSRLAQVDALIARLPSAPSSKGPIQDLLTDGGGVSFHRFQIAVWTIVLGVVFAWAVYRDMSMPEFDASLLTLMGISSGTYVGFKWPEKPKSSSPPSD